MSEIKTRKPWRSPEQIAIDTVEIEVRKRDNLTERRDKARAALAAVEEDLERSRKRVQFLLSNPDLPEGYSPPGQSELPLAEGEAVAVPDE